MPQDSHDLYDYDDSEPHDDFLQPLWGWWLIGAAFGWAVLLMIGAALGFLIHWMVT